MTLPWLTPPRRDARDRFRLSDLLVEQHVERVEAAGQFAWFQQMIGRGRSGAERALCGRERFVEHDTARHNRGLHCRKQIALQVSRDDDDVEPRLRQRVPRQVGAPRVDRHACCLRRRNRILHGVELDIDAECPETRSCQHHGMPAAPHGDIERARPGAAAGSRRKPLDPFDDEPRR